MINSLKVSFPCGGRDLGCLMSERNLLAIVKPTFGVPIKNERRSIRKAIIKAIYEGRLFTTLKPTDKVAIAVSDSTRPTPNSQILPIFLDKLKKLGIRDEKIVVIIATGMHEPDSTKEIRRNLGEKVLRKVRVINHNPDNRELLVDFGRTKLGTDIEVNKLFLDSDIRMTTGTVGPCMLAGWSGGGKTVMPGVSSRQSIDQNHKLFVKNIKKAKRGAMFGFMEGNLVRKDIDDYAHKVGVHLCVNTVQDAKGDLLGVYAGDVLQAFSDAVTHAKRAMTVSIPRKADVVVASPGVYTHEVSLYQSASRIFGSVEGLVKKGGTIILVSSCYKGIYEGIEKEGFKRALLQYRDPEEVLELTEKGEVPSFESCIIYQFLWMMKNFNIIVVTNGMSKGELKEIGMDYAPSIEKALEISLKFHGRDATITAIPYASVTYANL